MEKGKQRGEGITSETNEDRKIIDTIPGDKPSSGSTDTEASETKTTGRKRSRNRKNGNTEEIELLQAVNGLEPITVDVELPGEETTAPAPKKRKTKQEKNTETKSLINTVLLVGFDIVAARAGSHWSITQEEAENITNPLVKIMDRLNITEKVEKYGDWTALALAAGLVVVPRAMQSIMEGSLKNGKDNEVGKIAIVGDRDVKTDRITPRPQANDSTVLGSAIV